MMRIGKCQRKKGLEEWIRSSEKVAADRDFSGMDIFRVQSGLPGEIEAMRKTTPCQSYFQTFAVCGLCLFPLTPSAYFI